MKRKFFCYNCGSKFETYEENVSNCPICGSENITLVNNNYRLIFLLIVIGFILGFVIFLVYPKLKAKSIIQSREEVVVDTSKVVLEENIDTLSKPVFSVSEVKLKGTMYHFQVTPGGNSGDELEYALYLQGETEPRFVSESGVFSNIPPSDYDGIYILRVTNMRTEVYADMFLSGFDPIVVTPVPKMQQLTKSELQSILNNKDYHPSEIKSKFATNYKMEFRGLLEGEPAPDRFEEIFNRIKFAWNSVQVIHIEYDEDNRIKYLLLKVNQDEANI